MGLKVVKIINLKLGVLIRFAVEVFYITFMSQLLTLIHIIMIRFVKEFLINIVTSGKKMIYLMMEEEYKYAMTEDEMLYLTIHIQKITEDHKRLKNL